MTKWVKAILLILLAALVIFFAETWFDRKAEKKPDIIRLSGNIEVDDADVSFQIAGRVEERLVSEGETVRRGQVVARMESEELRHEMALRRAEVRAAEAELAELVAGSRPEEIAEAAAVVERARARLDELLAGSREQEIAAAEAAVNRARADMENLKVERDRYKNLFMEKVVSAEAYDQARTKFEMAEARLEEALEQLKLVREGSRKEEIEQGRAALREAEERYQLVKKGPREETIEKARARLERAQASLALAETRLRYTELLSPLSGVVLSENIEPGEYVVSGTPVVTVADLEHVWLRAYVNETDLGRVKVGQKVKVTTDTYPGKIYEGRLSFIAPQAEFTPKSVQTEKERVKLVYRVKVDIHNPKMELKPGMPADAEIILD